MHPWETPAQGDTYLMLKLHVELHKVALFAFPMTYLSYIITATSTTSVIMSRVIPNAFYIHDFLRK